MEVKLETFLTSTLGGGEWSASRHGHHIPREKLPVPIGSKLGVLLSKSGSRNNNHRSSDAQPIAHSLY